MKNMLLGYKRSKIACAQQAFSQCKQELERKDSKNRDKEKRKRENVWVDLLSHIP